MLRSTIWPMCLACFLLADCAQMAGVRRADPATLRDLTPEERSVLATKFSRTMKDPNATQFRWARIGPPNDKGIAHYCGQVNGKNSYGGYVGFQVFDATVIFVGGKIADATITSIGADPTETSVIREWCEAYGLDVDGAN
jgi:hypothetical protein